MFNFVTNLLLDRSTFRKIEGTFSDIGNFLDQECKFFDKKIFMDKSEPERETKEILKKDMYRTSCVSRDEKFVEACFDPQYQINEDRKGFYMQGAFTGEVFLKIFFSAFRIIGHDNDPNYKEHCCSFIYEGDDKEAYGFCAYYSSDSNFVSRLGVTFVDDFKIPYDKLGKLILIDDPNNTRDIGQLKGEIENNIKSEQIKEWLISELFKLDGSFNATGISNVDETFKDCRRIQFDSFDQISRPKEVINSRNSIIRFSTASQFVWGIVSSILPSSVVNAGRAVSNLVPSSVVNAGRAVSNLVPSMSTLITLSGRVRRPTVECKFKTSEQIASSGESEVGPIFSDSEAGSKVLDGPDSEAGSQVLDLKASI